MTWEEPFGTWDPNLLDPSQPRGFGNPALGTAPQVTEAMREFAEQWQMTRDRVAVRHRDVFIYPDEQGWGDRSLPQPASRSTVVLMVSPWDSPTGHQHDQVYRNPGAALHALVDLVYGSAADHDAVDLLLPLGGVAAALRFLREG